MTLPRLSRTKRVAYLHVMLQCPLGRDVFPKIVGVGIYSEATPTSMRGIVYAQITTCVAPTFHEAVDGIMRQCEAMPELRWALPALNRARSR